MPRRNHILVVGLSALVLALWPFRSASALTLVPPSLEYGVRPGQVIESKIKLYNESDTALTVFASRANFTAKGEDGDPDFAFEDDPSGSASWIEIPTGPITLKAQERLEVPITIRVPATAEPGGHYSSVFFGTDPSLQAQNGGQVTIRSLVGTLVILRVEGDVRELASIATFQLDGGTTMMNRLPSKFHLRVANTGNVHVRPQGTIVIKNLFGGESARLAFNDANGAVLPNSIRGFDVTWKKSTGAEVYKRQSFFSELGAEWKNFALGPYTATATLTYGQSKQTLVGTSQFTILPWRFLTLLLIIVVLVIWLLVWSIKRYNRNIIRRAQQHPLPPTKSS